MDGTFEQPRPEPSALDQAIEGLDHRSDGRAVQRLLERLFHAGLPADEQERQAERVRRLTRMNRATFRRLMHHAQDAVEQRQERLTA